MKPITRLAGHQRFLSNFYPSPIIVDRAEYPTVEHAYQALKTKDLASREIIRKLETPALAKKAGTRLKPSDEFIENRIAIMKALLTAKFSSPELEKALLDTGDAHIEEGNNWGDHFWGTVNGEGANNLGLLLMEIREEIRTRLTT